MKERVQNVVQSPVRGGEQAGALRPVDAFVVGGDAEWGSGQNLWLMLSRPGERLLDFFLDDDRKSSPDPVPCACAGVLPDGTVLLGEVDWELDRFLSELLDEQESAKRR